MITEKKYKNALKIIEQYKEQSELQIILQRSEILTAKRGDYVYYIGGSKSEFLIKGNSYRLTGSPFGNRINVIKENGKSINLRSKYFRINK